MKLAIIGSRSFSNFDLLEESILKTYNINNITHIVSGGAIGADRMGEMFAEKYEKEIIIHKPNWKQYGRGAGYIRNKKIIEDADCVIAFWDGISNGTKNSIGIANKLNKPITIISYTKGTA